MSATDSLSHAAVMDANYRLQRHIYDATRKYYLLGRDHLLANLRPPPGGRILEVGCGTGRNLIVAARRYPEAHLYGFDISSAMLETAEANVRRAGLTRRIHLAQGDAASFDPKTLFGVESFDRVFLSYTVSMIPPWEQALAQGLRATAPGGAFHVVDFGDQRGLPHAFKGALFAWLARFHVTPRLNLETVLREIARAEHADLTVSSLYRGYARYARIETRPSQPTK